MPGRSSAGLLQLLIKDLGIRNTELVQCHLGGQQMMLQNPFVLGEWGHANESARLLVFVVVVKVERQGWFSWLSFPGLIPSAVRLPQYPAVLLGNLLSREYAIEDLLLRLIGDRHQLRFLETSRTRGFTRSIGHGSRSVPDEDEWQFALDDITALFLKEADLRAVAPGFRKRAAKAGI
jgi:hypothetical protein